MNITQQTAARLWTCHQEIANGTKLLTDLDEAIARGDDPNPRDAFGRQRPYQLGMPHGGGHRLLDVSPRLARSVIVAHIAEKQLELVTVNEEARIELETQQPA